MFSRRKSRGEPRYRHPGKALTDHYGAVKPKQGLTASRAASAISPADHAREIGPTTIFPVKPLANTALRKSASVSGPPGTSHGPMRSVYAKGTRLRRDRSGKQAKLRSIRWSTIQETRLARACGGVDSARQRTRTGLFLGSPRRARKLAPAAPTLTNRDLGEPAIRSGKSTGRSEFHSSVQVSPFWRRKSRGRAGRPRIDPVLRDLIRRMSRENPLWGASRIHGELLMIGLEVAQSTVSKYMARGRRPPSQSWKTVLRNHADAIAAIEQRGR